MTISFPWEDRTPREVDTRESERRVNDWVPPQILPDPLPQNGWSFRWIRAEYGGKTDDMGFTARRREGWVPAKVEDHPELMVTLDPDRKHARQGNIEFGGLVLCKMPIEMVRQRARYYEDKADQQITGVNNQFLRDGQDSRTDMRTQELKFGTDPRDQVEKGWEAPQS